jgi:hypothetical protein
MHDGIDLTKTVIPIDEDIVEEMKEIGFNKMQIRDTILRNLHNNISTTYYLLLGKKIRQKNESVADLFSYVYEKYMEDKENLMSNYDYDIENVLKQRISSKGKLDKLPDFKIKKIHNKKSGNNLANIKINNNKIKSNKIKENDIKNENDANNGNNEYNEKMKEKIENNKENNENQDMRTNLNNENKKNSSSLVEINKNNDKDKDIDKDKNIDKDKDKDKYLLTIDEDNQNIIKNELILKISSFYNKVFKLIYHTNDDIIDGYNNLDNIDDLIELEKKFKFIEENINKKLIK